MAINMALLGFIGSNFGSIAMEDFGHMAGVASSYQSFAKTLLAAVVGALMVARFRTPSFKRATIYAENVSFVLLAFVGLAAALLTYPWTTLVLIDCAYLAMLAYTVATKPTKPVEDTAADA